MKRFRNILFFVISVSVIVLCFFSFASILLENVQFYNLKIIIIPYIALLSSMYGLLLLVLEKFIKPKSLKLVVFLAYFIIAFLYGAFQIASEVRGEFGATWLSSEVFWELVVYKGKGLWVLSFGLFFYDIILLILQRENAKNP